MTLWSFTLKWPNKIQILPICNYLHLSLMVLYKNQSQIQPLFLNQILLIENYSFWTTNTLKSFWDKLRCIIFNIESAKLNQNNQILELSAIEIENFKITGKIFWIHIKPRDFILNNFNDLDNEIYCAYSKYWEYYAQD